MWLPGNWVKGLCTYLIFQGEKVLEIHGTSKWAQKLYYNMHSAWFKRQTDLMFICHSKKKKRKTQSTTFLVHYTFAKPAVWYLKIKKWLLSFWKWNSENLVALKTQNKSLRNYCLGQTVILSTHNILTAGRILTFFSNGMHGMLNCLLNQMWLLAKGYITRQSWELNTVAIITKTAEWIIHL